MRLGLRIDVCTCAGLRRGVPALLALLDRCRLQASFFVALGPDTSGRALAQLFRPGFLGKLRRTRAVRTYGLRTILSGTLLPARRMAAERDVLASIRSAGHELGLHGYDHRRWQDRLPRLDEAEVQAELARAGAAYRAVTGQPPSAFGAPGWQTTDVSLLALEPLGLVYASDTRGSSPFLPVVRGRALRTLQLPTSLPTLDERLGLEGANADAFPALVLTALSAQRWPVLTLHAEMEGGRYREAGQRTLEAVAATGIEMVPLATLAEQLRGIEVPTSTVVLRPVTGRAGTVAMPARFPVE